MIITPDKINLMRIMVAHTQTGVFRGRVSEIKLPYFAHATRLHDVSGVSLTLTRDVGMHTSGWFKNPDYDKCWHLSIAMFEPGTDTERPFEMAEAEGWVRIFFEKHLNLLWHEGPTDTAPMEVHHYRLMVNEVWIPILPRLEVYSKEFTEKNWKSFSEVQAAYWKRIREQYEREHNE